MHKNGNVSRGRGLERTPAAQKGHNLGTIAICLHGFHIEKFTQAQYHTLQTMANYINSIYYERISFHGHEEVAHKSCPIFNYRAVLKLDRYGSLGLTPSHHTSVAPSVSSNYFVELHYGDSGKAVRKLQQLLHIKVTGIYKRQTLAKVKDFKRQHGLYPSAIVTKQVWKLLTRPILSHTPPTQYSHHTPNPNQLPELRRGSRGSAVELLQRCLFIKADGIFGPQVAKAVKNFKARHGLYRSDIVNEYVWKLLLKEKQHR